MPKFALRAQPAPLEKHEQEAYFAWLLYLRWQGLRVFEYAYAIPNGSYLHGDIARRAIQGEALRRQGVRAGVPDVFVAIPAEGFHGLYIEFKRIGAAKPSYEQLDWHTRLAARGYAVVVAYGFEAAQRFTLDYFALPQVTP